MKHSDSEPFAIRLSLHQIAYTFFLLIIIFLVVRIATAATPNPGHPWTDIGDGTFVVAGPTVARTFNFPDASSTVLTTGGAPQSGTIPYGNGTGVLATTSAGTNGFTLALVSGTPTWVATTTLANISGTLPLGSGGTNASLTANNGGILYSGASAFAVLAGTATANQILLSGASAAPAWSTATYPSTAGTAGNVLMSNGTNFVSTATSSPTINTVVTRPINGLSTGAITATSTLAGNLTTRDVGIFNVPGKITVNQVSFSTAAGTAGTAKVCVYSEDGNTKIIDVTSGTLAVGANSVSVSAIVLQPGNYYVAIGCATTCTSNTLNVYTETTNTLLNTTAQPSGKEKFEGRVTHSSGTCDSTLGTITPMPAMPLARLDN